MTQDTTPATYGQILRSSALIGGASAVTVLVGIVRVKVMATLLGPAGIGLFGTFGAIVDLARTVAEFGINRSGVRQIAAASASGDSNLIALTSSILGRTAFVLAVIGAIGLAIIASPVSMLSFGSDRHTTSIALLSLAVLFGVIAGGHGALLQGLRRIGDLARMGIWGSVLGTVASIAVVYFLGEDGVALSLVVIAAITAASAWWYSRKQRVPAPHFTGARFQTEAASLLKLGLAFMASGLLTMGAAYVVRIIVLRNTGLDSAGLYQAAWTLSGLYVAFILQAMGTDFYPRLVSVVDDAALSNRVVNEQTHVSLLLAGPGMVATMTLAPAIISLFYTVEFVAAVDVMRWICLGMALRIITWPLGFIIVAKNHQALFFGSDLAWTIVNVSLSWYCVQYFGLAGAGIAFFGSYIFHGLLIYPIVNRLTHFKWSTANRTTGGLFLSTMAAAFYTSHVLPSTWALACGLMLTLLSTAYSIRSLTRLLPAGDLPRPLQRILLGLRLARSVPK